MTNIGIIVREMLKKGEVSELAAAAIVCSILNIYDHPETFDTKAFGEKTKEAILELGKSF